MRRSPIYFVERNSQGYWVIYGLAGVRKYLYYTKAEAMKLYREHYEQTYLRNRRIS